MKLITIINNDNSEEYFGVMRKKMLIAITWWGNISTYWQHYMHDRPLSAFVKTDFINKARAEGLFVCDEILALLAQGENYKLSGNPIKVESLIKKKHIIDTPTTTTGKI